MVTDMTIPKSYLRIMLGRKSRHAETCRQGQFIGADYGIKEDLNHKLPEKGWSSSLRTICDGL
jgi:hypothetical protein